MVRREGSEDLEEWMEEARGSGIPEMKGFATKLRQDLAAGLAAKRAEQNCLQGSPGDPLDRGCNRWSPYLPVASA
jgi:hypothetical protein